MVVHSDKLRWLFWLRWKMLTRGFVRNKSSLVGSIILLLVVLGFSGFGAFGTVAAYRALPPPANYEVLYLVLTGLFFIWIFLPLLEFTGNEGLDLSKLSLFPLTRGEQMMSLLFSTLLDVPTIGLLMLLGAVVVGWAVSLPVALVAFVSALIFYVQLVGISQLVLAFFMRVLQSRRFRDFSIIMIALLSSSCYLIQQFVLGGSRALQFVANVQAGNYSPFLQWLPPGFAASAIKQAALGNWGVSLLWLALLLVVSALFLFLWQIVLERSLSASEAGGSARPRRHREPVQATRASVTPSVPAAPVAANPLDRWISPQIPAIALKELKYYWRDPQLKVLLFQSVIYMFIFFVFPLFNSSGRNVSRLGLGNNYLLFAAALVVLLYLTTFSMNTLGLERQSLTTTFLFPVPPQRLLFGKNLAQFSVGLTELVVLLLLGAFFSHAWALVLPVLTLGLAGAGITLGCGNFTSVFFPQYVRPMQRGFRTTGVSSQNGCLRAVMSLVMLIVTALLVAPVALGLFLPLLFNAGWIWSIAIPLSLAYGIAFHQVVTRLVAPRIVERVPEILAVVVRE